MVKIVTRFLLYAQGGRIVKNVYGEAPPQGPTPYLFIYLYLFSFKSSSRAVTQDFKSFDSTKTIMKWQSCKLKFGTATKSKHLTCYAQVITGELF